MISFNYFANSNGYADFIKSIKTINSPKERRDVEESLRASIGMDICDAPLQFIIHLCADSGKDYKKIRNINEMLIAQGAYTPEEAIELRANQAIKQILEGDVDNIQDAIRHISDMNVYKKVNEYFMSAHYKNETQANRNGKDFLFYMADKLPGDEQKQEQNKIFAELARNQLINVQTKGVDYIVSVATRLINDENLEVQEQGFKLIKTEELYRRVNEKLDGKLEESLNRYNFMLVSRAILTNNYSGLEYLNMHLYLETEPQEKHAIEQSHRNIIEHLEAELIRLETAYKSALDEEGLVSAVSNSLFGPLGTSREEIEAIWER